MIKSKACLNYLLLIAILIVCESIDTLIATPINNLFEPQTIHTALGTDKFYKHRQKSEITFHLAPYYSHTASAKDKDGIKVSPGFRLGPWNMLGLFYDYNKVSVLAPPSGFNSTAYNTIKNALTNAGVSTELFGQTSQTGVTTTSSTTPPGPAFPSNLLYDPSLPNPFIPDPNYTIGTTFPTGTTNTPAPGNVILGSFLAIPVKYEKIGVRGQLSYDFGFGFGFTIKGGMADYRSAPSFLFDNAFYYEAGLPYTIITTAATATTSAVTTGCLAVTPDPVVQTVYNNLLSPSARDTVASIFDFNFYGVHKAEFEDSHVQCHWHAPFNLKDKEGDIAVTVVPYLAGGVWIPTGKKQSQDRVFDMSTGNNGFYGFTAEGSIAFNFPHSVQVSVGGGALFSETKDFASYRVPTDIYQIALYPWKTSVRQAPGTTWYFNASCKAENFTDGLSCYFDYIFTQHLKDSFTLTESNQSRAALFTPGIPKITEESAWKSQQFNLGMEYKVTPVLTFGCAVQSHITGVRIYRPTTILGTMTFVF
jgi:hypothetical protein